MPPRTGKTDTPVDSGEPTTSVTETDASASVGQAIAEADAAGTIAPTPPAETPNPAPAEQAESVGTTAADPQRVQVEITQPEPAPAVFYGEDAQHPTERGEHVKAEYQPFQW